MIFSKAQALFADIAATWKSLGRSTPAFELVELFASAASFKKQPFADFLRQLDSIEPERAPSNEKDLVELTSCLSATEKLFQVYGKKDAAAVVSALLTSLERIRAMSIRSLFSLLMNSQPTSGFQPDSQAANDSALTTCDYANALSGALGDRDEFQLWFERLKSDSNMKQPEVVEVASKVAFKMAKKTSRKLALERIWEQHQVSESTGAKIRASNGKSAA